MHSIDFEFDGSFSDALIEKLTGEIQQALSGFELRSFSLGCTYPYAITDDEKQLLKKEFQFALVKTLEKKLGVTPEFDKPDAVVTLDFNSRLIHFWLESAYFKGNYNKFSRSIAQTTFYCPKCKGKGCAHCDGKGKLGLETVEELIGNCVQPIFGGIGFAFHGAGREDVDVRMLGDGRPFVMEIKEPHKRSIDLIELEKKVNEIAEGKIKIFSLEHCAKKDVALTKEERHRKKYGAVVTCAQKLNQEKLESLIGQSFTVQQQTPLRVIKRRTDMTRPRHVTVESVKALSETEFEIVVITEAGLYVKEFISGESGRSDPSLSGLLENQCSCKQLDVLGILSPKEEI